MERGRRERPLPYLRHVRARLPLKTPATHALVRWLRPSFPKLALAFHSWNGGGVSVARDKIRAAVEAKGYALVELTWEPWGQAAEKEGIPGGWWGRVEPDPSPPGSSGLDWFGGLSWQETVAFIEDFIPARLSGGGDGTGAA